VSGTRALAAEGTPRVRVVVDTNLLVSGVISAAGLPRQLLNAGEPRRQGSAVTPGAAELARVALHRALGLLDQNSHHMQHAVHVECKTQSPEGWKTPRIELDSGLFTVRAATRPKNMGHARATVGGSSEPGAGPVRRLGVGPSFVMRPQSPNVPPRILRQSGAFMLGGDGSKS
jgi:hypothetical protein